MHPFLTDVKTLVLDTLFPISCITCNANDILLCQTCLQNFTKVNHQVCIVCRKPSPFGMTHLSCQTPLGVNGLISLFDYKDTRVAKTIIYGKYKFLPQLFQTLSLSLTLFLEQEHLQNYFAESILTPLPLHSSRKRWRGFNQAQVIVDNINLTFGIEQSAVLNRTRATKVQKNLNHQKRQTNIEGCFEVNTLFKIEPKNYILVDDVITTGATLKEATKVLKSKGAKSVWCFTLARD